MQFKTPLIAGTLIKRYKRFLADVELDTGEIVTAHCPNTGAMTGCAEQGCKVYLSPSDNPKRKLAYTWELAVTPENHWIGIHSAKANRLVEEAWENNRLTGFQQYSRCQREVAYGREKSKIDLLLSGPDDQRCYIEVKSVTLLQQGQGYFPDAVSTRGQKHLRELMEVVQEGHRGVLFFCVQHTGISSVSGAAHIDPQYAELLQQAKASGVEVCTWGCRINPAEIQLDRPLNPA